MAVSYSDKQFLASDPTFQNRVRQSMIAACVSIASESPTTVAFHRERATFGVACMNSPDVYKLLFANAVANDASVIADATAAGTVVLSSGNVAAQAALVTDAHMDTAVSSQFNSFFRTPAS
jgi:hypothetical protein